MNTSISTLMHQFLSSTDFDLRQLGCLGCGVLRDHKATEQILQFIRDNRTGRTHAAFLALVAIGNKDALEAVAYSLMHGDEQQRRIAAEALVNHPEEGYPTLEEGSSHENPAIRRAVVFGLGRINQPWTIKILEKLHLEDSQWIVQDAAREMLNIIEKSNARIPRNLPELPRMAWLINFAAERAMGIAPGKPAHDLLYQALKEGNDDQCFAALYYISRYPEEEDVLPLYQFYFSTRGNLQDAILNALWSIAASGIHLPPPIQYGYK